MELESTVVQGLDLAQKERRLTQVHPSRRKGKSTQPAPQLSKFGGFPVASGTRRILFTAVFTVLPCVVSPAGLAFDFIDGEGWI